MVEGPLHNPGVTPSPKPNPVTEGKPEMGPTEGVDAQKPFNLPPDAGAKGAGAENVEAGRSTPMDVARDASQGNERMSPEELTDKISKFRDDLSQAHAKLSDPNVTKNFTDDHHKALGKLVEKMNPDMRTIANNSGGKFEPTPLGKGGDLLAKVGEWINGSQKSLGGAMDYLSKTKNPNMASFMKLQYSVQRASQRGELFASIISSSVGGIKTIMSTQLG
ncbi:MAG: hypothetical protein S4CHLAM45_11730 [Chlamydiales bacterium]|nr:hypothetical protein [Chlamydiales bacterium]MCH9619665.1 hypothetical protein [Chlamydiales bacterium]MCH9623271.1 hypothetical protein [Chlamydiales bacterium]